MKYQIIIFKFHSRKPYLQTGVNSAICNNLSEVSGWIETHLGRRHINEDLETKILELLDEGETIFLQDHNLCIIPQ